MKDLQQIQFALTLLRPGVAQYAKAAAAEPNPELQRELKTRLAIVKLLIGTLAWVVDDGADRELADVFDRHLKQFAECN